MDSTRVLDFLNALKKINNNNNNKNSKIWIAWQKNEGYFLLSV